MHRILIQRCEYLYRSNSRYCRSDATPSKMGARDDETCVLCRRTGVRFWGPEDEFCRWCAGMKGTLINEFHEQREHHWFETLTEMEKNQLLCDFVAFRRRPFGFCLAPSAGVSGGDGGASPAVTDEASTHGALGGRASGSGSDPGTT